MAVTRCIRNIPSSNVSNCAAAELGSSRALDSDVSYVGRVGQILPRQSARQEERIREAHARLEPTLSAQDAEARFLACAATFDTYALDPFAVKVCMCLCAPPPPEPLTSGAALSPSFRISNQHLFAHLHLHFHPHPRLLRECASASSSTRWRLHSTHTIHIHVATQSNSMRLSQSFCSACSVQCAQ